MRKDTHGKVQKKTILFLRAPIHALVAQDTINEQYSRPETLFSL